MGLSLKAVTANEQIEWMAQRELEMQESEAVDATAVAEAEAAATDSALSEEE
jgi:hypothetical protein